MDERHFLTPPEICRSWHLHGATIPIGANVRVGPYSPPSVIISSFAYSFLGVSLVPLRCISLGACHGLTKGSVVLYFLMFTPAVLF